MKIEDATAALDAGAISQDEFYKLSLDAGAISQDEYKSLSGIKTEAPVVARPRAYVPEPVGLKPLKLAEFTPEQISKVQEPTAENLTKMATAKLTTPEPMKEAARRLVHGSLGLAESVGTGLQYVGAVDLGDKVEKYWGEKAKGFEARADLQVSVTDNPSLLKDPSWWAGGLAEMLPSFAAAMVPGIGAARYIKIGGQALKFTPALVTKLAKVGTALTSGLAGGAIEGSQTYKIARDMGIKSGLSKDEAHKQARIAASEMTAASAALNAISFGKMLSGKVGTAKAIKHILGSAAVESGSEVAEEPTEAAILERLKKDPEWGRVWDATIQGAANVGPLAFIMGGAGAGGSLMAQRGADVAQGGPEAGPGAPAGPGAQPRPPMGSFEGTVLEFKIKTAMGLKPADKLTPEAVNAAFAAGKIPQDLAEQMGHPGAIQAAAAEATKNAPPAPALAPEEAMIQQVVADKTKTHEALSEPHPVTGQKPYQMSEQQYGAALRELDPNISGEEIAKSYEKLLTDAKDVQLVDERDIEIAMDPAQQAEALAISDREPVDYDFDLMDAGPASLSAMPLDELQAKFPGAGEQLHRELVVEGLNAGQILPEQAPYADIKKAAIDRVNQEQLNVEKRQEAAAGSKTPILQMAWKRKLNRAAFAKEGFDVGALRGYFTEKGGMTPELATENAYEMGWIPEYDQAQFFEKLDAEMMRREGVIRSPEVGYRPGVPEDEPFSVPSKAGAILLSGPATSLGVQMRVPFEPSIAENPAFVKAKELASKELESAGVDVNNRAAVVGHYYDLADEAHTLANNQAAYEAMTPKQKEAFTLRLNALFDRAQSLSNYAYICFNDASEVVKKLADRKYAYVPADPYRALHNVVINKPFLMSPGQEYTPSPAPAFYSKLAKTIEAKMSGPMPAEQLLGLVKSAGIKQDELDWFDLPRLLKDNPKPTKQQVLDYLAANALEIKEVSKGGNIKEATEAQYDAASAAAERNDNFGYDYPSEFLRDAVNEDDWTKTWEAPTENKDRFAIQEYIDAAKAEIKGKKELSTKFSKYQLPGGENYREVLFILPGKVTEKQIQDKIADVIETWPKLKNEPARARSIAMQKLGDDKGFTSSHWAEPNVLAHMRLNDRTIDGKRTLFLEEIQSDWLQKGREVGFKVSESENKKMVEDWKNTKGPKFLRDTDVDALSARDLQTGNAPQNIVDAMNAYMKEPVGQVPDAPLKKTWHEFVMKRALRMAAEEGYDAVAWTTGAQQAERYDLSKQVDQVQYQRNADGSYDLSVILKGKDTPTNAGTGVTSENLEKYVGKDLAVKIRDNKMKSMNYKGLDLKIGDHGMTVFYDQMLPGFVGKFTKKWGGVVKDATVLVPGYDARGYENEDFTAHSLTITPELKQAALAEGFPLFAPGHVYTPGEMLTDEAGAGADTALAVADTRRVLPVGQYWTDIRPNPAIDGINKQTMEKGFASAVGMKIDTIQDVAEIDGFFVRHPGIEHYAVTKLKDGRITGSLVLTSGKVGYFNIDVYRDVIDKFLSTDCDSFYDTHGHPSGDSTPSVDDIKATTRMAADKRYKGHVVTNHKTYTAIMPDGTAIAQEFRNEKQSFRTDIEQMSWSPAVVGWAHGSLQGDKLGIMFVDVKKQVMSFDQVDPRSNYNAYIQRNASKYGAVGVFLVTGDAAAARMTPRVLSGSYYDLLVISADGQYRSAALGHLPGFSIDLADTQKYPELEGVFGSNRLAETPADYHPEEYNKVLGRFKPGMTLTLRNRLVTPQFPDGLPRGAVFELVKVSKNGEFMVRFNGKVLTVIMTPNMFKETYREPGAPQPGQKERKFINTVRGFEGTAPEVKDTIAGNYEQIHRVDTLNEARAIIDADYEKAVRIAYENGPPSRISAAISVLLIVRLQKEGQFDAAGDLVEHTARRSTEGGQASEILSAYRMLTPEGILRFAQRGVNKARIEMKISTKLLEEMTRIKDSKTRIAFAKRNGIPVISPEQAASFYDMAVAIAKMEEGRPRDMATGKMMLEIAKLVPVNFWDKVSAFQTISMLLNPKTFIRNLVGNTMFIAFENFSQASAVPLDMLVGVVTGKRSVGMPGIKTQLLGFGKGTIEGTEEAWAGVDLKRLQTKDLPMGPMFDNVVMKRLEFLLNMSLRVTDRAFYQAAFEDTLREQMALEKIDFPTPEMVGIANATGLYRTFNDPNVLRSAFLLVKRAFNLNQRWGAGDMVIKFAGTPASIISRGIEYSPFGFAQTAWALSVAAYNSMKGRSNAGFDQRAFVLSASRAMTGSVLQVGTGLLLAALGIILDDDRDETRRERESKEATGLRGKQINISALLRFSYCWDPSVTKLRKHDLLVSFDWAQPVAIGLQMGADLWYGDEKSASSRIINSLTSAGSTLEQQALLQGVQKFFNKRSFSEGFKEVVTRAPASFVPTLVNQFRQLIDNVSRNTQSDSYLDAMGNQVKMKVPGLSGDLPPRVDVLGRVRKTYQNDTNNPFNVFLNPAFVNRYEPTPATELVLDIWARSGETIQLPRIAPRQIKVRGVTRPLTEMEQAQFQHYIGERTTLAFTGLARNPDFLAAPDYVKAKHLQAVLTDIYYSARVNVLGVPPK